VSKSFGDDRDGEAGRIQERSADFPVRVKKGVAELFEAVGRSRIAADWKVDWKVRAPFCFLD